MLEHFSLKLIIPVSRQVWNLLFVFWNFIRWVVSIRGTKTF